MLASSAAAGPPSTADIQRALRLLSGIGTEYQEAFDQRNVVVRPLEIEEARLLLAEVRDLTAPLAATDASLENIVRGLGFLLEAKVPPQAVAAYCEVLRRNLVRSTGVHESILPPARPSLARGRAVFEANCVGCHGASGAGDGPDAARLGIRPASFSDLAFMRGETPQDSFNVVSLGRQKSGMPAWGDALSVQEVWDTVSYVWSLGRTPATLAGGQRLYADHCARCHGPSGDPADSRASGPERPHTALSGLRERAAVTDTDVFTAVTHGIQGTPMTAFAQRLTEDERWQVVAFVRTLSLEGHPGAPDQPLEPDHAYEIGEVRRLVDAALDAHRRGDPAAVALATNAYQRFEPLERPLGDVDEPRMEALEGEFIALRTALRDKTTGDPEEIVRRLRADLDAAATILRGVGGSARGRLRGTGFILLALLAVTMVVLARMARRRSSGTRQAGSP
jgi:high-affinity iron transporter